VSAAVLCTPADEREAQSNRDTSGSTAQAAAMAAASCPQLYNVAALKLWLLRCCQGKKGGLRDKPGTAVDYYHTCYCLSGLASCQAYSGQPPGPNSLAHADPLCNVVDVKLEQAIAFFSSGTVL
jgi:protein farnesyltransferase subunit beta